MIEKLTYCSTGTAMRDGSIFWERHPNQDDIVEKINEIIDFLNRLDEVEE